VKKILMIRALAALVVWMIAGTPTDVGADRIFDVTVAEMKDPAEGYSTVVCSVWNNDSDPLGTACYSTFDAPAGYWFHMIVIEENVCNDAQAVTIRFWASSTDSTSIYDGTIEVDLLSGGTDQYIYPVRCYKVSVIGISATEDLTMIGYARDH